MNTTTNEGKTGPNPAYDATELARLARLCIGSSSILDFSERTGLSRSFLSAIQNGKLRGVPTRRSLKKMTSPEALPQNGVTTAQLLKAAGYVSEEENTLTRSSVAQEDEQSNFIDAVRQYCAADTNLNYAAQCMIGELLNRGMKPSFSVEMEHGWITIRENQDEGALLHVCIPAFAPDQHLAVVAASAAVLKLGEARKRYKKDERARYYLLADSEGVRMYLAEAFGADDSVDVLLMKDYRIVSDLRLST